MVFYRNSLPNVSADASSSEVADAVTARLGHEDGVPLQTSAVADNLIQTKVDSIIGAFNSQTFILGVTTFASMNNMKSKPALQPAFANIQHEVGRRMNDMGCSVDIIDSHVPLRTLLFVVFE
eukprot:4780808-Pyramimonas_sp.AAC.1